MGWNIKERRQCAEKNGIYAYDTLDDVLSDKSVKIITVAIPNDSYEDVVVKALEAGKHVICEKPVALTLESLERMISTAKRNNVLFSTHQNGRWDVDFLAIKQIKESGEIGEVLDIESRVQGSRGIPSDWRCEKIYGGGMLYDRGFI